MDEWISVEDKGTPEINVPVIAILIGGMVLACRVFIDNEGWYWALYSGCGHIDDPTEYDDVDDYEITHWMPLPKPPKDE